MICQVEKRNSRVKKPGEINETQLVHIIRHRLYRILHLFALLLRKTPQYDDDDDDDCIIS